MKHIPDTWAKKAKSEGYRSRASFKLLEIDKKYDLIRKSNLILELGSSPGGWSQVISKKKNKNCKCMAIDILNMEKVKGVNFYKLDLIQMNFIKKSKVIKIL